jgi:hypothetical protein
MIPSVAGLMGVALVGWASLTSGFDAECPRPNRIAYELNADTGQARWISPDRHLDDWTRQFFPAQPERVAYEREVATNVSAYAAPAPVVALAPPEVAVVGDTVEAGVRTLRLRLVSPRGASELDTWLVAPGAIVAAAVDGRPLDMQSYPPAAEGRLLLTYAGVPPSGVELMVAVRSTEPLRVTVRDVSHGLPPVPGVAITPRPPSFMPALGFTMDPTLVRRTFGV